MIMVVLCKGRLREEKILLNDLGRGIAFLVLRDAMSIIAYT